MVFVVVVFVTTAVAVAVALDRGGVAVVAVPIFVVEFRLLCRGTRGKN